MLDRGRAGDGVGLGGGGGLTIRIGESEAEVGCFHANHRTTVATITTHKEEHQRGRAFIWHLGLLRESQSVTSP